jgi:hypothetical protein
MTRVLDSRLVAPRFTLEEVERARDEWGLNCGPAAIAAMNGLTLEELRPHLGDFESKRYTNPTLMWGILKNIGAKWRTRPVRDILAKPRSAWPSYGLARVQWEGPWTAPGVPIAARYRHTHWVGAMLAQGSDEHSIFDINCICEGGWVPLAEWSTYVVPWLLKQVEPKASGVWHLTHIVEIERVR